MCHFVQCPVVRIMRSERSYTEGQIKPIGYAGDDFDSLSVQYSCM